MRFTVIHPRAGLAKDEQSNKFPTELNMQAVQQVGTWSGKLSDKACPKPSNRIGVGKNSPAETSSTFLEMERGDTAVLGGRGDVLIIQHALACTFSASTANEHRSITLLLSYWSSCFSGFIKQWGKFSEPSPLFFCFQLGKLQALDNYSELGSYKNYCKWLQQS